MITAKLADGRELRFPDGTDPAVIQRTVKKTIQAPVQATDDLSSDPLMTDPLSLIPGQDSPPVTSRETTIGEDIVGAGETALTMASGATTGAGQGIASFAQSLIEEAVKGNLGSTEAANRIEQETLKGFERGTYAPRTEAGQRQAQAVGEVAQQAMPAAGLAGEISAMASAIKAGGMARPGTQLIDDSGMPTRDLQKALSKEGLVFEGLNPEVQAQLPKVAGRRIKSNVKGPVETALTEQIKAGGKEDSLAPLMVKGNRVVSDPLGNEAIRQGFENGFVQAVKTANPETKAGMRKMLSMMERIKGNRSFALKNRLTDITGDSFGKRVSFIRDKANKARSDLNRIAQTELKGQRINTDRVMDAVMDAFDDLEIEGSETVSGRTVPVFRGSMISKDKNSQKLIRDALDLVNEAGTPDAYRLHRLKRQLDAMIDFRKKKDGGLSEEGRNALKSIRHEVNQSIREVNPGYADVNDILHKSLTALDNIKKAAGPSIDIFGEGGNKALGQDIRRIMSNNKSRVKLENAISGVEDAAADLGGVFGDNVSELAQFANLIEDRFGAVAGTSFKGEIESAAKSTIQQGARGAMREAIAEKVGEGVKKARGINDFNAFRSMQELLNREN